MSAHLEIPGVQLFEHWLRVHFAATPPLCADFHYLWLRSHCDRDRHPLTGERLVDSSEIPPTITPLSAQLLPAGELEVCWDEPGGRTSRYSLGWLHEHAYAVNHKTPPPPPGDVAAISFSAIPYESDAALVKAALQVLELHGAVVVHGFRQPAGGAGEADPADTEALITALSAAGLEVRGTHFGRIEDLRTDNTTNENTDQLGYTDAAIEPHTDQPFLAAPPRYQLLHCMRPGEVGGDNYVVDGLAAARYLAATDAHAFRLLRTTPVHFHRRQRAFQSLAVAPILNLDEDGGFQIRYSYFTMDPPRLPFDQMEDWYRAYRRFAALVRNPAHQYRLRLSPGDFLLYDNHRMLHARSGFRGARWVRGVYFDPATVH
jgi:gamma-butyrobetaine dioxygenase/trimethyllysine dioxygenase